jgi:hypothetical protein
MTAHLHRLGIAVLLLSGLIGVLPLWQVANPAALEVQHRDCMLALLSATLVLLAFLPKLRLPGIAASVLSKLAFIAVTAATAAGGEPVPAQVWVEAFLTAALLAAGTGFWREGRQEARWNSMLPLRSEA